MAELRSFHVHRDAVVVRGPEAVTYLQGQLSQDVAGLEVGGSAWSWLLQPAGKVDALVRVTRTSPDSLLVDVDDGWGEPVLNRLTRFKLRTKAEFVATTVGAVAIRGPGAGELAREFADTATIGEGDVVYMAAGSRPSPAPFEQAALAVPALWPPDEEAAEVLARTGTSLLTPERFALRGSDDEWEVARIAAGVPAMGAELTEKTIPAETGLVSVTASFTKGCYTGQELVARIDSRGGNVPRHLRRLRSASPLEVGSELVAGDKVVGTVTSSAVSASAGPVALAYVGRAVEPGQKVDAGGVPVDIVAVGNFQA